MKRYAIAATAIVAAAAVAPSGVTLAHHTDVTCADKATATWTVANSEHDKHLTFTSPQGPAGVIAAGATVTVVHVGDRLQIDAIWDNGHRASNVGVGDCTPDATTTTSSTTTVPPSTTVASTLPPITGPATVDSTTTEAPPVSTFPFHGATCLLYATGSLTEYSGSWLAEGEWVGAGRDDAEGTTYVSGQWCKRTPSDTPPTTVATAAPELPATGPDGRTVAIAGLLLAVGVTLLGLSRCGGVERQGTTASGESKEAP